MGRWKGSPQGPYWDPNDTGPNQVDPPPGMSPSGPGQPQPPQSPAQPSPLSTDFSWSLPPLKRAPYDFPPIYNSGTDYSNQPPKDLGRPMSEGGYAGPSDNPNNWPQKQYPGGMGGPIPPWMAGPGSMGGLGPAPQGGGHYEGIDWDQRWVPDNPTPEQTALTDLKKQIPPLSGPNVSKGTGMPYMIDNTSPYGGSMPTYGGAGGASMKTLGNNQKPSGLIGSILSKYPGLI